VALDGRVTTMESNAAAQTQLLQGLESNAAAQTQLLLDLEANAAAQQTLIDGKQDTITSTSDLVTGNVTVSGHLQINGNVANTLTSTYAFFRMDGSSVQTGSAAGETVHIGVSAPSSAIFGGQFITVSDERLKKNVTTLEPETSLEQVMTLQPVEFEYRDSFGYDAMTHTGFIAQQIGNAMPNTTRESTGRFVPTVYQMGSVNGSWIEFQNPLDRKDVIRGAPVQIQTRDETLTPTILDATDTSIRIDTEIHEPVVFVYGTWSETILTIDYDAVSSITVSALQALTKKIVSMEREIDRLKGFFS